MITDSPLLLIKVTYSNNFTQRVIEECKVYSEIVFFSDYRALPLLFFFSNLPEYTIVAAAACTRIFFHFLTHSPTNISSIEFPYQLNVSLFIRSNFPLGILLRLLLLLLAGNARAGHNFLPFRRCSTKTSTPSVVFGDIIFRVIGPHFTRDEQTSVHIIQE